MLVTGPQLGQPLLNILNVRNPRVSVFPEVKEFQDILFSFFPFLWIIEGCQSSFRHEG